MSFIEDFRKVVGETSGHEFHNAVALGSGLADDNRNGFVRNGDVSEFIVSAECHISPYKNTLLLLYFTIIIKI